METLQRLCLIPAKREHWGSLWGKAISGGPQGSGSSFLTDLGVRLLTQNPSVLRGLHLVPHSLSSLSSRVLPSGTLQARTQPEG